MSNSKRRSVFDRGRQTDIPIRLRLLTGDRNIRIISRQEDRNKILFVDRYSPMVFVTIEAILFLSVIDAILTLFLLDHGAHETNPLMAYLLSIGPLTFLISKFALTIIAIFIFFMSRSIEIKKIKISAPSLLSISAWIYAAVVAWELYLVYYVI